MFSRQDIISVVLQLVMFNSNLIIGKHQNNHNERDIHFLKNVSAYSKYQSHERVRNAKKLSQVNGN